MNYYKKIIKNEKLRFKILHLLRFVPNKLMIKLQYRIKLGRKLKLKNPQRYTEKLQWYKIHYRNPLMTQCCDKYRVREYIESKGLGHILNKIYGVYNNFDELNLENLPSKFVLKSTNGSGTNLFCKDKSALDLMKYKKEIDSWLKRDIFSLAREWSYKNVEPKIIVEEYLEDKTNEFTGINDYKFICFNGRPAYIVLDVERHIGHKRNIYDINWNLVDVSTDYPNISSKVKKPKGFEQMLEVAKILSKDFPFVRVDLYWLNNSVYFGELTFYPWSGYVQFDPDSFDYLLGMEFNLPTKK